MKSSTCALHQAFTLIPLVRYDVLLFVIPGREYQHHGCQVAGAGKVKPGIAGAAFQFMLINSAAAFVSFVHGRPADQALSRELSHFRLHVPLTANRQRVGVQGHFFVFNGFPQVLKSAEKY